MRDDHGSGQCKDSLSRIADGIEMRMQVVSATGELLVTVREAAGMSNREDESYRSLRVDVEQSRRMSEMTIAYYDRTAEAYWDGTRDHDVSQNYTSLLDAIENDPPYSILDLGCGPGRDLYHFRSLGHNAVGLDGSKETEFRVMAEHLERDAQRIIGHRRKLIGRPDRKKAG